MKQNIRKNNKKGVITAVIAVICVLTIGVGVLAGMSKGFNRDVLQSWADKLKPNDTSADTPVNSRAQISVGDELTTLYFNTDFEITDAVVADIKANCTKTNWDNQENQFAYVLIDSGDVNTSIVLFELCVDDNEELYTCYFLSRQGGEQGGLFFASDAIGESTDVGWIKNSFEFPENETLVVQAVSGQEIWSQFISKEPFDNQGVQEPESEEPQFEYASVGSTFNGITIHTNKLLDIAAIISGIEPVTDIDGTSYAFFGCSFSGGSFYWNVVPIQKEDGNIGYVFYVGVGESTFLYATNGAVSEDLEAIGMSANNWYTFNSDMSGLEKISGNFTYISEITHTVTDLKNYDAWKNIFEFHFC